MCECVWVCVFIHIYYVHVQCDSYCVHGTLYNVPCKNYMVLSILKCPIPP